MAKFKNDKGLTLIELLITISVLAVVSAIALPVINNVVASSNSNAAVQTQNDVTDFIAKYNGAGETLYANGVFSGYVDADGDNTIDSNELVDTLTIDSKFTASVAGTSDTVGGSYTADAITGATVTNSASSGSTGSNVLAPITYDAAFLGDPKPTKASWTDAIALYTGRSGLSPEIYNDLIAKGYADALGVAIAPMDISIVTTAGNIEGTFTSVGGGMIWYSNVTLNETSGSFEILSFTISPR